MNSFVFRLKVGFNQEFEWQAVMILRQSQALVIVCVKQLVQLERLGNDFDLSLLISKVRLDLLHFRLFLLHFVPFAEQLIQNEVTLLQFQIEKSAISFVFTLAFWFFNLDEVVVVLANGLAILAQVVVGADRAFEPDPFDVSPSTFVTFDIFMHCFDLNLQVVHFPVDLLQLVILIGTLVSGFFLQFYFIPFALAI
jgi:hypothetical protein